MTFLSPAHKPDSKGHTCGARKVCCRADQQTRGCIEGEGGSRETRGATEESTIGMLTLLSEPISTAQSTTMSTVLLIWFSTCE